MGPWTRDHFFGQFWKLGFCSISECLIFAHRGQLGKFLNQELMARIPTCNLSKHNFMTYRNLVLMHGFHYMPRLGRDSTSILKSL